MPALVVFLFVVLGSLQFTQAQGRSDDQRAAGKQPIIVFLSNLGTANHLVAVCNGVMWSIAPGARVVSLTHEKIPHRASDVGSDIRNGARFLYGTAPYFPEGTIFVAAIEPRANSPRALVVKSKRGQYFVLPDDGLVTLIEDHDGIESAREITNSSWMMGGSQTASFPARDILAPVAAHLALGEDWTQVGPEVKSLARSAVTAPSLDDHGIRGEVVFIDMPYGNVITDISGDELGKLGYKLGDTIRVKLGTAESGIPFVKTYSEVAPTKPLLYVDPRGGYVALAINEGNFGSTYGVTVEKTVAIAKK